MSLEQLQQEIIALKTQLDDLKLEYEKAKLLNKWYEEQLKLSRQKRFGASSEKNKYDEHEQLNIFNEAEAERAAEPFVVEPTIEEVTKKPKKKAKRGEFTKELPVETIEYTLTESEKICPKCEGELTTMKQEIRKEIKIIPAQVSVVEHVTEVCVCRNCDKNGIETPIIKANSPKALIPKSLVSPSVMAYIMNQKFTNAMPLNRQEQEFKRFGVVLSRQNMSNWVVKGAELLKPLASALKVELLKNEVCHADETTLEVLCEPGRPAETNSYMWLYRTSGDAQKAVVLYDYQEGRAGKFAKDYLTGFEGYLHCDGWGGYKQLEPDITLVGCWAHMRRKFDEALVPLGKNTKNSLELVGQSYCDKLFAIEREICELSFEEKFTFRQEESKPVSEAFFAWISDIEHKTLPQSLLGKAITYGKNQKKYLLAYLDDGRLEISNNRAERSIKPFVIGRKNWLFCNTPGGAKSSAIVYTIIQTALENGLKPFFYLEHIFTQLQLNKNIDISTLLPWADQIPDCCKLKIKS